MCCWSDFNREEHAVFGYVHFINTECCIKFTEMGVIWVFFLRGVVYMQIVKKVAGQQGSSF